MKTPESIYPTRNNETMLTCLHCAAALLAMTLLLLPAGAATRTSGSLETTSQMTIPWAEVGAAAGTQYSGDGLTVTPTRHGARLRCVFQRMEGEAAREGLWLSSTVTNDDRFRVTAMAFGRAGSPLPADGAHGVARSTQLPAIGNVSVDGQTVRFTRPGLVEEYTVSMDGVRQDFVVLEKPGRASVPTSRLASSLAPPTADGLRVALAVTGAKLEPIAAGVRLVLEKSGRKIAYSRLKVTDANGKELPARIEVSGSAAVPAAPVNASLTGNVRAGELFGECVEHDARGACAPQLAILVDDADAVYPVRIDPTFSDANWISMSGGIPGADSWVLTAVADASGNLYVGGYFTQVGDVVANRIAKWNGSTWSALGSVSNSPGNTTVVSALAVSGSDLYAGGYFSTVGGVSATNVAKWNGTSWSALGSGMNHFVYALAVSGSDLYAGGQFTTAGGIVAKGVAKWNGGNWSALGSGINGEVSALAVSGSDLYAGGAFRVAGGIAANGVAKWDGSSWSALGSGIGGAIPGSSPGVGALAVSGSDLFAGGEFTTAGGIAATNIAKWDGSSWSALGSGINGRVHALAVSGSDLYAGGHFSPPNDIGANEVAKWNGSTWSALGLGMSDPVRALVICGSELYAAGEFSTADGNAANGIARWDGGNWTPVNSVMSGSIFNNVVSALAVSGSDLYAGGRFTTAGGIAANYIVKWDGSSWSPLGSGMSGPVTALAVSGSDLYAGGTFATAGGVEANSIAKWNGSTWSALGSGVAWPPNIQNYPISHYGVLALAASGSDLYAGGYFTTAGGIAATNIAKWNGSNWSTLGAGLENNRQESWAWAVYALAVLGNDLYAGGSFTTAGGIAAMNIAKWNGTNWSALGSGVGEYWFSSVNAIAAAGNDLYVGGHFATAGGSSAINIAKWNGSSWSALGFGLGVGGGWHDDYVNALAVSGSDLYAGGTFTTVGGIAAVKIAKWNGSSWSALGSGMNADVSALAVSGSDLYAGGGFLTAGGKVSAYLAKAIINPPVLTLEHSASGTNFIRFSGVPGTAYHLQRAPALTGPWPNIATNTAPTTGRMEIRDGSPPPGQGFYRVSSSLDGPSDLGD